MHADSPNFIYDAAIVGAGPSGAVAAHLLAGANKSVILLEKNSLPRYKTCGGGVVFRACSFLPYQINEVVENYCFAAKIIADPSVRGFSTRRNEPIILMVMREKFDFYLIQKAKMAGAQIKENCEVKDLSINSSYIELKTSSENIKTRFIIASDGALGFMSRKAGFDNSVIRLPALESEVFVKTNIYSKFNGAARFDFNIVPGGYGWVFPKKDHLSIGVVNMKTGKENLNGALRKYFSFLGIDEFENIEKHGFIIPVAKDRKTVSSGRILLTGDAAALADPVTGEGISNAILSGRFAAESIIEGGLDYVRVTEIYNYRIKKEILKENNYAKIIAALVYSYPSIRKFLFKNYGQRLSELMTEIITGKLSYSSLLTNPANYFKLLKYFFIKASV